MFTSIKRSIRTVALMVGVLLVSFGCGQNSGSSSDASAEEFFAQEKLTIAGGHEAGSGFDFYMRATANAIPKVSDVDTTVRNIPGGGGLVGDNQVFEAEPNGATIGMLNFPGHVFAQLTGSEGVRFDFKKWEWLGRVASGPPVILVAADGDIGSAEDLINSSEPVEFGIEEAGSDAFYGTALAANTFGFEAKKVTGYEGSENITTAILRGEVDATFLSVASALPDIKSGDLKAIMLFSDEPAEQLPDVPLATEFAPEQEDKETLTAFGSIYAMERVFVAPPGTPEDRVEYLRDLLMKAFEEEGFIEEAEAAERPVDALSGAEVASSIEEVAAEADKLKDLLK